MDKRSKRKSEIVDISAELFFRRGFNAVGVAEISETVGLGRGALYHYIGSKDQLLVDIQERVLGPLNWVASSVLELDREPLVKLRIFSHFLIEIMTKRLPHVWVYQNDYRSLDSEALSRFIERRSTIESTVRQWIEECIADGIFEPADGQLRALEYFNHHNYTYQWFRPDGRWGSSELSAQYCRTLMRGFGCSEHQLAQCEKVSQEVIAKMEPGFAQEIT